jgi:hypothetical protein
MKTKYYINKDKGVVVCIITVDGFYQDLTFVGKASCSPEDEFDENLGKRIANLRAHIKYHQANATAGIKEYKRIKRYIENDLLTKVKHSESVVDNLKSVLVEISNYE